MVILLVGCSKEVELPEYTGVWINDDGEFDEILVANANGDLALYKSGSSIGEYFYIKGKIVDSLTLELDEDFVNPHVLKYEIDQDEFVTLNGLKFEKLYGDDLASLEDLDNDWVVDTSYGGSIETSEIDLDNVNMVVPGVLESIVDGKRQLIPVYYEKDFLIYGGMRFFESNEDRKEVVKSSKKNTQYDSSFYNSKGTFSLRYNNLPYSEVYTLARNKVKKSALSLLKNDYVIIDNLSLKIKDIFEKQDKLVYLPSPLDIIGDKLYAYAMGEDDYYLIEVDLKKESAKILDTLHNLNYVGRYVYLYEESYYYFELNEEDELVYYQYDLKKHSKRAIENLLPLDVISEYDPYLETNFDLIERQYVTPITFGIDEMHIYVPYYHGIGDGRISMIRKVNVKNSKFEDIEYDYMATSEEMDSFYMVNNICSDGQQLWILDGAIDVDTFKLNSRLVTANMDVEEREVLHEFNGFKVIAMNVYNNKAYVIGITDEDMEEAELFMENKNGIAIPDEVAKKVILEIDLNGKVNTIGETYGGGLDIDDGKLYTWEYDMENHEEYKFDLKVIELD